MELLNRIRDFAREEDGITAIEYGLLASLIALVMIAGAQTLGEKLDEMFNFLAGEFRTKS